MDKSTYYVIRITGHLADTWAEYFNGMEISNLENGEAVISGYLPDQSALHGILNRINNLGLTLISVNQVSE